MPVLRGGAKTRKVKRIRRGTFLGDGSEGNVYNARVTVEKGSKTRRISLAEKEFYKKKSSPRAPFRNPEKQFELMEELQRENRKKKMGLRIVPTIRLRKMRGKKSRILTTKLDTIGLIEKAKRRDKDAEELRKPFIKDMTRQIAIGKANGWNIYIDAFEAVVDKKSGKVVAVIADFGNVTKYADWGQG